MLSSYKKKGTKQGKAYRLTYTLTDFYNSYKKEFSDPLSKKQYMDLVKDFFNMSRKEIIESRLALFMPFNLGVIRIKKKKNSSTNRKIDFYESGKQKKIIYHTNLHSDMWYFMWYWEKKYYAYADRNYYYYNFRPVRKSTRSLAAHIKKCAADAFIKDYDCLD